MSRSYAVAADVAGNVVAAVHGRPMSLNLTPRNVIRTTLHELIADLQAQLPTSLNTLSGASLCVGMSGVTFPYDADDLREEITRLRIPFDRVVCTSDTAIIFASHALSPTGSALVCNMCASAYFADNNRCMRCGGWGPFLGGEGSGYRLALAAVRSVGEELDVGEPASILWKCISEWLSSPGSGVAPWRDTGADWRKRLRKFTGKHLDPRTALFSFAHESSLDNRWVPIASGLTIPLMRAFEMNDPAAARIVNEGAHALAQQYGRGLHAFNSRLIDKVVMYGGLFTHHRAFRDLVFTLLLSTTQRQLVLVTPESDLSLRPVYGALMYLRGGSTESLLHLPGRNVMLELRDRIVAQETAPLLPNT